MKIANIIVEMPLAVALLVTSSQTLCGQGTFQNLDFERASVPDVPFGQGGDSVSVSNGAPGWVVYLGGMEQASMVHNDASLGGAVVAILGPHWFPSEILQGNYTLSLQSSFAGPPVSAAIGQTGQLPPSAESIRFYGQGNGAYLVTFAGHPISLVMLGGGPNYTIFGGDISSYANQTGELLFQGSGLLDAIQFSNQPVPEPGLFEFSALGALLLGWHRLRRPR